MKIWAHRGCSLKYPENTLIAFEEAAKLQGLTGIELDVQLSADDQLVVIHDETVDRTTNGKGAVKDYTLKDLKKLRIKRNWLLSERIPELREVLELLKKPMGSGLLLNIELKTSKITYEGIEKKVVELVCTNNMLDKMVFSSFNPESLKKIRQYEPNANTAILAGKASQCIKEVRNGCYASAIHPCWNQIDIPLDKLLDFRVRAYGSGPIFPARSGSLLNVEHLASLGITDVYVNNPEAYLRTQAS